MYKYNGTPLKLGLVKYEFNKLDIHVFASLNTVLFSSLRKDIFPTFFRFRQIKVSGVSLETFACRVIWN